MIEFPTWFFRVTFTAVVLLGRCNICIKIPMLVVTKFYCDSIVTMKNIDREWYINEYRRTRPEPLLDNRAVQELERKWSFRSLISRCLASINISNIEVFWSFTSVDKALAKKRLAKLIRTIDCAFEHEVIF